MLPPIDMPPTDWPHSWCNYLDMSGELIATMHTRDDWAYCFMLQVDHNGAHTSFFRRSAPLVFTCFGGFNECLEYTEQWFAACGIDIPGWAKWIEHYHVLAQHDGPLDYEAARNGMIVGGPWSPFCSWLEEFYAKHYAKLSE